MPFIPLKPLKPFTPVEDSAHTSMILALGIGVVLLLVLGVLTGFFLFKYYKTSRNEFRQGYMTELMHVRLEIYEQTFKNIAQEIHDNAGQRLSLMRINLQLVLAKITGPEKTIVDEVRTMAAELNAELRQLSHNYAITSEDHLELPEAIESELVRFNIQGNQVINLEVDGIPHAFDPRTALIILRIFQEALEYFLSFDQVMSPEVSLNYGQTALALEIAAGNSFAPSEISSNKRRPYLELSNARKRCKLLGGQLEVRHQFESDIIIKITLPYRSNYRI